MSASMFTMTVAASGLFTFPATVFRGVPVGLTIIAMSASMFTMTATAFRLLAVAVVTVAMATPGIVEMTTTTAAAVLITVPTLFPVVRVIRATGTMTVTMAMAIAIAMTVARHLPAARVIGVAAIGVLVVAIVPVFRGIFAVLCGEMVVVPGLAGIVGVVLIAARVGSEACSGGSGAGGAGSAGGVEGLAFGAAVGGGEAVGRSGWGSGFGLFEEVADGEPIADDRVGREVRR
jgi:hypothetical protein